MSTAAPRSIRDLEPLETGGTLNRQGLAFQDHVALGFCLDMLLDTLMQLIASNPVLGPKNQ